MDRNKTRFILFLSVLGSFLAWIAVVIALLPDLCEEPTTLDIVTAFGLGGVTTFFMLLLKDAWQFYWRKAGPEEK